MTLIELFAAIADAIRTKKGTTDLINATDFPSEITNLSTGVKLFETVEEMDNSTDNKLDDLAIVYKSEINKLQSNLVFTSMIFPNTVVLDEAITTNSTNNYLFDENNTRRYQIRLTATRFIISDYSTSELVVRYDSTDGITYSKVTNISEFNFESPMHFSGTWINAFSEFATCKTTEFNGLYQYGAYTLKEYCICTPIATLNTDNTSLVRKKVLIPKLYDVDMGVKFTAIHSMEKYNDPRLPNETDLYRAIDYDIYVMLDDNPSNMHTINALSNTGKFRSIYRNGCRKYTIVNNEITGYVDLEYSAEGTKSYAYFNLDTSDHISIHCKENSSWTVLWVYPDTSWSSLSTGKYVLNTAPDSNFLSYPSTKYLPVPNQINTTGY